MIVTPDSSPPLKLNDAVLHEWQDAVNGLARTLRVPTVSITRHAPPFFEIVCTSQSNNNPLSPGGYHPCENSYCEAVIRSGEILRVPDATKSKRWENAPGVKSGVLSYLGLPVFMPDGKAFGTFFIMHTKANSLPDESEKLLRQFKGTLESHLASLLQAPKTNTEKFITAITKKKAEKTLEEYQNRIEELETSNHRLKISMEDLKRSNQDLKEFAFLAAHDLQEPLRKIKTLGSFIQKHSENLDEKCQGYFDRMIKASTRMQHFIDDLLKLAQVTKQIRQRQKTDLNNLLQDVLLDLEDRITSTCAEIQVGELPLLSADAVQMKQLFQNLLSNSLKFHRKGIAPAIKVSSQLSSNGHVEIIVEDNGIGICPEHNERIFRPFERLHGRDEYEGSGMGLAMCQKIVSRHGWEIKVEGIPDQGTKIVLSIPLEQT